MKQLPRSHIIFHSSNLNANIESIFSVCVQLDMAKLRKKNISAFLKHLMTLHNLWFFACSPIRWNLKGPFDNSKILYDPCWSFFVRMTDANVFFDMPKIKNSLEMYRWKTSPNRPVSHIYLYGSYVRYPYALGILGNWSDGWLGTKAIPSPSYTHTLLLARARVNAKEWATKISYG